MTSPFVPGARVARQAHTSWVEDFVHKVYKNGNFTLVSDPQQQWRPCPPSINEWTNRPYWSAMRTAYGVGFVRIWDDSIDAELAKEQAKRAEQKARDDRRERARLLFDRVANATDSQLSAIEAILTKEPKP